MQPDVLESAVPLLIITRTPAEQNTKLNHKFKRGAKRPHFYLPPAGRVSTRITAQTATVQIRLLADQEQESTDTSQTVPTE